MHRVVRSIAAISLALVAISIRADDPPSARKSVPPVPGTSEVRFADGSTVRMVLTQSEVEIVTRYGKLKVPVADIRRIEIGFRYPDGLQVKLDTAIGKLSGSDVKEREQAAQELEGYGALAYSALKRAAAGTQTDTSTRALAIVRKLEEKFGVEKLKFRDQDVIHATEFVLAGRIESPTLKGRTTYFGEVSVQVSEVRTIRFLGNGGEVELVIDAAKYAAITHDVWLDTEVDVTDRAALEIIAAGQVDLRPMIGNFKVGPDAQPRRNNSPDGNPAGILLGRIGERGKTFQIGSRFSNSASEAGRLYLRIACSPWNIASSGSYSVKINPNADDGGFSGTGTSPLKKFNREGPIEMPVPKPQVAPPIKPPEIKPPPPPK